MSDDLASRASTPRRIAAKPTWALRIIVGCCLAAGACSGSTPAPDGDALTADTTNGEAETTSGDIDTVVSEAEQASSVGTSSLGDFPALMEAVKDRRNQISTDCMSERGFPESAEAMLLRTEALLITSDNDPLAYDPLNVGPHTEEQARTLGVYGIRYQIGRSAPGNVLSNDKAFDKVAFQCDDAAGRQLSGSVREYAELTSTYKDLFVSLSAEFLELITEPFSDLMRGLLTCLSVNYRPGLDVDAAMADSRPDKVAKLLGIEPGVLEPRPPRPDYPEPGSVLVYQPSYNEQYTPSESEVEHALDFVACSVETDFVERFEAVQATARQEVLSRNELVLLGLREQLVAALG